jgi:coenzyme F420 biosynthesis associated uncharacterized protein
VSDGALVDLGLAQRVATAMAREGEGPADAAGKAFGQDAVDAAYGDAVDLVLSYTQLRPAGALPQPELVDRAEWVRTGLRTLRELSGGLERRVADGISLPGPLGGVARSLAGAAAGAEAGIAVGYGARKVMGQYDVSLAPSDRAPRLLFVRPNLVHAHAELGESPRIFLRWIAIHETTHAVQFGAVSWLRDHLARLLEELIEGAAARLDGGSLRQLGGRLFRADPRETIRTILRGDFPRLLAGPEQARTLDRLQMAMTVIEGHAEHVMDAAAAGLDPGYARLRGRLEARRSQRGGLGEVISRLLGMELKMRQYRLGKAFCDRVVAEAGVAGVNHAWRSPEDLPTPVELERPLEWLDRVGARTRAEAG